MVQSQRSPWDWGRFLETLRDFEVFPFSRCINNLLGKPTPMISPPVPDVRLVAGPVTSPSMALMNHLLAQGHRVYMMPFGDRPSSLEIPEGGVILSLDGAPHPPFDPLWFQDGQKIYVVMGAEPSDRLPLQTLLTFLQDPQTWKNRGKMLFDFQHPQSQLRQTWGAIDDVVMGGVSTSRFQVLENQCFFAGQVSTANNGGFASIRSRKFEPALDLGAYDGIELRVKGDGKRYKFILRSDRLWDGTAYCYSFDTVYDFWTTITIPFSALIPTRRANTIPLAGPFPREQITAFQWMLSKFEYDGALNPNFEAGSFQLELGTVRAYGGDSVPEVILVGDRWEDLPVGPKMQVVATVSEVIAGES